MLFYFFAKIPFFNVKSGAFLKKNKKSLKVDTSKIVKYFCIFSAFVLENYKILIFIYF